MYLGNKRKRNGSSIDSQSWITDKDEEMEELIAECKKTHQNKRKKTINKDPNPWTEEEDIKLVELVTEHGQKNWTWIASHLNNRNGKQCRERYVNKLDPSIIRRPWTVEEEVQLINHQNIYGNAWAQFSRTILPGRSQNDIKNHFNGMCGKNGRIHYLDYLIGNIESDIKSERSSETSPVSVGELPFWV